MMVIFYRTFCCYEQFYIWNKTIQDISQIHNLIMQRIQFSETKYKKKKLKNEKEFKFIPHSTKYIHIMHSYMNKKKL